MLRSVAAVAAGYLIFGLGTAALFAFGGQNPRVLPSTATIVLFTACGAALAFLGGYFAALVASQREALHAAALAALIGVIALVSLALDWSRGSVWTELAVLVAMVPAAVIGGLVRQRAVPFRAPAA
jgi:hypothetical protein